MKHNATLLALKQLVAFCIDMVTISFVLVVHPSLESYSVFVILWIFYIPLCEYFCTQTLGMRVVGTHIYATYPKKNRVSLSVVARRHIARVGFLWGVIGWLYLLINKQLMDDYIIVDDQNHISLKV